MEKFIYNKFSAVVPSYNESKRCTRVISELLKIKELFELIFVDDGSTDDTENTAKDFFNDPRFRYIKHKKNKGKGAALFSGIQKAKSDVILFLDADLQNITAAKIKRIVYPVLKDEVDVARGAFRRRRGRVTEYAVRPMMEILFPGMYFEQPISGQICAKKSFLKSVSFEKRYGVDIGLLFDAIESGQRIIEVDIGKIVHKANKEDVIGEMSRQVLETMIKKAGLIQHKYKLVIFTLDDTLIKKSALDSIFKKLGVLKEIEKNSELLRVNKIDMADFLHKNARLFEGISIEKITEITDKISLAKYSYEVIHALRKRKYQVGIISSNFSPIVASLARRLGVPNIESVGLVDKNGLLTGKITEGSVKKWSYPTIEETYRHAFVRMVKKSEVRSSEVVMVASSERAIPLMTSSGLSIAYHPKSPWVKTIADKTISLHAEILAIIE
ncbi:MAG: family 2 glycosyl transferase [Candidatus Berkelbacteria bacterium Athens1014_28]|uniref:Family 2 glycosyl transferase n=1 Tax=Candidatus Berkelbacteria bacterium Athens1014_28 TaxID=2017145 RepID=A0A554LK66_9BACT|nr:MAG: family 2 glycosyl transferase [Candidatus Berkelbacteria bacterium Athens1014_28]